MSDRKYRQRGYQDEPREREKRQAPRKEPAPRAPGRPLQDAAGPKTPNLMPAHEVFKCARCGNKLPVPVEAAAKCARCGADVHSCVQCVSFDTSARFECAQPIAARVSPKDARNECPLFAPRTTVERQTGSPGQTSARQAFDDLFK
ncbi:MAG: hypothetical protein ACM3SQ_17190 [Betaproteobacteria bacterium]